MIADHLANYAALLREEGAAAGRSLVQRAVAGVLAAVGQAGGYVLSKMALRSELEGQLNDRDHIINGLRGELLEEKKSRHRLEELVEALKGGSADGTMLAESQTQLDRERSERRRLEEILKRKDDELQAMREAGE